MACLRANEKLWLLDSSVSSTFPENRLPSKFQVLLVFSFHHLKGKETKAQAAAATADKLLTVWQKANIPTSTIRYVRKKILKLNVDYAALKRDKTRTTEGACVKRAMFKESLEEVFDVAHSAALVSNIPEEDKVFLMSQREDRHSSSMTGVDLNKAKADDSRRRKRDLFQERRKEEAVASSSTLVRDVFLESSTSSSAEDDTGDEFQGPCTVKMPRIRRPPHKRLSLEMTAAWDRDNLSVRAATSSFAAAAVNLGHDLTDLTVSRSSVHRARTRNRAVIAAAIVPDIKVPLVLHWDGKLLPNIADGKSVEERIAVLVTGEDTEELLGVPVSPDATGAQVADTVLKTVREARLEELIIGVGFDTTPSNTGPMQGVCTRLEQALQRPLMWFACRHHIMEIVLKDVFELCLGPTSGPDIALFKRLQKHWPSIDQTKAQGMPTESLSAELDERRLEMIAYLKHVCDTGAHPREDYGEMLDLCLVYLGGSPQQAFRAPGAYHMARWMAKAIYSLKIALFHDQLTITPRELAGIRHVASFVAMVYVRYWHEATIPSHAAKNDVDFIQDIQKYAHQKLAGAADRAMRRHLWYVAEELVGLALFDERVPADQKAAMVQAMETRSTSKNSTKRLDGKKVDLTKPLSSWCTKRSVLLFTALLQGQKPEFLETDLSSWPTDPTYILAARRAAALKVTNDVAERGIALIKRFIGARTKSEEQTQFLLKVARHHARMVPKKTKAELQKSVLG